MGVAEKELKTFSLAQTQTLKQRHTHICHICSNTDNGQTGCMEAKQTFGLDRA